MLSNSRYFQGNINLYYTATKKCEGTSKNVRNSYLQSFFPKTIEKNCSTEKCSKDMIFVNIF